MTGPLDMELKEKIAEIGKRVVECESSCTEILCDRPNGIPPRCLILESRSGEKGCAIVGLNPGKARPAEINYYKKHSTTYTVISDYWNLKISHCKYYEKLRILVTSFGFNGPILWTELAKCQNSPKVKFPSLRALRTCTGRFLTSELEAIPAAWPLFAIGREAYTALAYRYPEKTVIGVPHVTGARGDMFSRHLPTGRLHGTSKMQVQNALAKSSGELLWLGDPAV